MLGTIDFSRAAFQSGWILITRDTRVRGRSYAVWLRRRVRKVKIPEIFLEWQNHQYHTRNVPQLASATCRQIGLA